MVRRCSECGASLRDRMASAKTCSDSCRTKRTRRVARSNRKRMATARAAREYTPEQAEVAAMVSARQDVVRDVMRAEVTPIVREALTDDVLAGIQQLVRLTPKMIAAIEADLGSGDDGIRQRAYTLLAKYTLGNPAIAPPPETPVSAGMQVFFEMPRPGGAVPAVLESSATEVRECVECKAEKDAAAFVADSDRCQECHDRLQATVRGRFGEA